MLNDLTVVDKVSLEKRVNNTMMEEPVCILLSLCASNVWRFRYAVPM